MSNACDQHCLLAAKPQSSNCSALLPTCVDGSGKPLAQAFADPFFDATQPVALIGHQTVAGRPAETLRPRGHDWRCVYKLSFYRFAECLLVSGPRLGKCMAWITQEMHHSIGLHTKGPNSSQYLIAATLWSIFLMQMRRPMFFVYHFIRMQKK